MTDPSWHKLSITDQALLHVDRAVRAIGGAGFETQLFVWLAGRAEVEGLRAALGRLGQRYPLVTARLVGENTATPLWRCRPDGLCLLRESNVASAEPQAVLDAAARLYVAPSDPSLDDPLRCHLLHRPDGRDVFLLQYNHALMDNNAALLLLREIERLRQGIDEPPPVWPDLVGAYLRRASRASKQRAGQRAAQWPRLFTGGVTMLGRPAAGAPAVRFLARRLDEEQTHALRGRIVQACGMPSLSMALVGSAFRAIDRLTPQRHAGSPNLIVGIGTDLGLRGERGPIFQNLTSLLPLRARAEELADRDELLRLLVRQLREHLENRFDLSMLRVAARLNRRPDNFRYVIEMGLRLGFSLWYAYFGSADAAGQSLAGAEIEDVFSVGPSWPPVGLTLLANQFRGRLGLQVTYVPASVPETLAQQFLDWVMADLV
jgi:hypothetical protein